MPISAELSALTVPEGTEFPGTVQELLDLLAQYLAIVGLNPFSGVALGDTQPTPEEQDRPWFKTDASDNPIGWFAWDGSAWTPIPSVMPSGDTASRPAPAIVGQTYYDTDIDVALMFNGAIWVTQSGSPGDVKSVKAVTLAAALLKNPGWSHDSDSEGMVIAGASDGSGAYAYGTEVGADEVTIDLAHLPNDTIAFEANVGPYTGQHQNGAQPVGVYPIVTGAATTMSTGPINPGAQTDLDVRQKTIYYWRLVKS